ncbi:MAG: hypothetical protein ACOCWA_00830 [Bacteroidota bacterium]
MPGLFLLIVGNIFLVYLIANALDTVPFTEKDWIIITDFQNLTSDRIFEKSLNTALEISLQQSSFVNVYPRLKINHVLQRMEVDRSTTVTEEIGFEIARREGIKVIVACTISKIGTTNSKMRIKKTGMEPAYSREPGRIRTPNLLIPACRRAGQRVAGRRSQVRYYLKIKRKIFSSSRKRVPPRF